MTPSEMGRRGGLAAAKSRRRMTTRRRREIALTAIGARYDPGFRRRLWRAKRPRTAWERRLRDRVLRELA